jgi:hypothetical protein
MPLVDQALVTLPEHLSSLPVFSGVDTKEVIRIRISKNRQFNGEKKKYKRANTKI